MGVFDVNRLASDSHAIESMKDCVHASVIVSDERIKLGKADANVWGFMMDRARNILGGIQETQGKVDAKGANEPSVPPHELAASLFKAEADEGLLQATRESRYTDKQVANYKKYTQQLTSGLMDGAPLLARDDNGNFAISGKSKFEKWHRDHKEAIEQAKLKELAAARKHLGIVGAGEGKAEEKKGEVGAENPLDFITSPELRELVRGFVETVANCESHSPIRAAEVVNGAVTRANNLLSSLLKGVKNAAGGSAEKGSAAA